MDKFEVLDRKLNMIFDSIISLRERFERLNYDREMALLKDKAERAERELSYKEDNRRYLSDEFDYICKEFKGISEEYRRVNRVEETEIL